MQTSRQPGQRRQRGDGDCFIPCSLAGGSQPRTEIPIWDKNARTQAGREADQNDGSDAIVNL